MGAKPNAYVLFYNLPLPPTTNHKLKFPAFREIADVSALGMR